MISCPGCYHTDKQAITGSKGQYVRGDVGKSTPFSYIFKSGIDHFSEIIKVINIILQKMKMLIMEYFL